VIEEGSDVALPPGLARIRTGGGKEEGREGGTEGTEEGAITVAVPSPDLFPLAPRTVDMGAALPILLLLRSPGMGVEGGRSDPLDEGVGVGVEGGIEEEQEEEQEEEEGKGGDDAGALQHPHAGSEIRKMGRGRGGRMGESVKGK